MFKVILIDIDDTILDFNKCAEYAMKKAAVDFNISWQDEIYKVFTVENPILWQNIEKGILTKDELHRTRWNIIFAKLGIVADGEEFEKRFRYHLESSAEKMEGAEDLLVYLKSKYKVYAASNAHYEQQLKRMALADFSKYIDGYFISEKIGAEKPSKEFFDACLAGLDGVSKSEVIMIGDSLSADIKGAKEYGLTSIWMKGRKEGECAFADYTVSKLEEIKEII